MSARVDRERNTDKLRVLEDFLDRTLYYGILAVAFLLPLLVSFWSWDMFELIKATFLWMASALLFLVWIGKILVSDHPTIRKNRLFVPIVIFLAVALAATLNSIHLPTSVLGKYGRFEGLVALVCYGVLFFLVSQAFERPSRVRVFLEVAVLSAALISVYGIVQHLGYDFIDWTKGSLEETRGMATYGNPMLFAGYLVLALPLAISLYLEHSRRYVRYLFGVCALIIFASLVTTYTRGAWVGAIIGFIAMFYLLGKQIIYSRTTIVLFLLLILVILGIFGQGYLTKTAQLRQAVVLERLKTSLNIGRNTLGDRLEIWKSVIRMISKRPLLGWGPDTLRLVTPKFATLRFVRDSGRYLVADEAHNYFLQLAATTGLLGLAAFLATIIIFFWQILAVLRSSELPNRVLISGLVGAVSGYLGHLLLGISVVGVTPFFWMIMALASAQLGEVRPLEIHWRHQSKRYRLALFAIISLVAVYLLPVPLRPFRADAYLLKAKSTDPHDFPIAASLFQKAIDLAPYNEVYLLYSALFYDELASSTGIEEYHLKAIQQYLAAQRASPDERASYILLSEVYLGIAQSGGPTFYYDLAHEQLNRELELFPLNDRAHYLLAVIFYDTGKFRKTIDHAKLALRINPEYDDGFYTLGRGYEALGQKTKAIEAYKRVLKINNKYEEARSALKALLKG